MLREQLAILHRRLLAVVQDDEVCRRLMTVPLFHNDPRASYLIQEPLQVKAGELIVCHLTEVCCERRDCTRVAGFHFGKGLEITLCRGIVVSLTCEGFEGA